MCLKASWRKALGTHAQAMHFAQQHQLSFHDAHIVATAQACDAQTLMSEDMHHGMNLQGLLVQNPFSLQ